MDYKKAILGAASVLALLAGQGVAQAAVAPTDGQQAADSGVVATGQSDPLFKFAALVKDGESPSDAIASVFAGASPDQIEQFPAFLAGVSALQVSADVVEASREELIQIAYTTSDIDPSVQQAVVAQLRDGPKPVQLAQNDQNNNQNSGDDSTDRRHRTPDSTGAVGNAGAGGRYQ